MRLVTRYLHKLPGKMIKGRTQVAHEVTEHQCEVNQHPLIFCGSLAQLPTEPKGMRRFSVHAHDVAVSTAPDELIPLGLSLVVVEPRPFHLEPDCIDPLREHDPASLISSAGLSARFGAQGS